MVTGDNVKTAKAIAVECGILSSFADATDPNIIEGKNFRALTDAQRDEIAETISVKIQLWQPCSCALIVMYSSWQMIFSGNMMY